MTSAREAALERDRAARAALGAGVGSRNLAGKIPRSPIDRLISRIDAQSDNHGRALSGREVQIVELIADGFSNDMLAAKLFLSKETIKSHVKHILVKLGARNRAHMVLQAFRRGYLTLPAPETDKPAA